jgi:hypothetical protein
LVNKAGGVSPKKEGLMALRSRKTRLMVLKLKKPLLLPIPLFSERAGGPVTKWTSRKLRKEMRGKKGDVTDAFLDLLLMGMDLAFSLMKDYRKNIENFEGCYEFETRGGLVKSGVIFNDGNMKVQPEGIQFPDAKVTFEDFESLSKYIFSKDQEILDLMLENKIELEGNMNLLFKFCFMVKDLKQRLGLET